MEFEDKKHKLEELSMGINEVIKASSVIPRGKKSTSLEIENDTLRLVANQLSSDGFGLVSAYASEEMKNKLIMSLVKTAVLLYENDKYLEGNKGEIDSTADFFVALHSGLADWEKQHPLADILMATHGIDGEEFISKLATSSFLDDSRRSILRTAITRFVIRHFYEGGEKGVEGFKNAIINDLFPQSRAKVAAALDSSKKVDTSSLSEAQKAELQKLADGCLQEVRQVTKDLRASLSFVESVKLAHSQIAKSFKAKTTPLEAQIQSERSAAPLSSKQKAVAEKQARKIPSFLLAEREALLKSADAIMSPIRNYNAKRKGYQELPDDLDADEPKPPTTKKPRGWFR